MGHELGTLQNKAMCQTFWEAAFNSTSPKGSVYNGQCPGNDHSIQLACQLGFGCCNGVHMDDATTNHIKVCTTSYLWDINLCASCAADASQLPPIPGVVLNVVKSLLG